MPTAIYKVNRRFDYCDADRLRHYLWSKGVNATVEPGYPLAEIHITSDAPLELLNEAVDRATMRYCDSCVRKLRSLDDHML